MNTKTNLALAEWNVAHRAASALTLLSPVTIANRYTVKSVPSTDAQRESEARDGGGVAEYTVEYTAKSDGKPRKVSVQLYYRLACYPIPVAFGRNGEDGGELRFESGWYPAGPGKRECQVTLTDFDGEECLPKTVCAVLRALGFTVSDDNLSSPL